MRHPDYTIDGQTHVWHVPMDPLYKWVNEHREKMPRYARGELFERVWRDLWYVRAYVHGGDYDDEIAESVWFSVILRDLRRAPDNYPRMYREAEWDLTAEELERTVPPINGDGLYDQLDQPPTFVYQFHGLTEAEVMDVRWDKTQGEPESFAVFGWEMIARGRRPDEQVSWSLSRLVNGIRERANREALSIDTYTGMLSSLEDGSAVTPSVNA